MKDMENGTVHEKRDGTMRRLFVSLKGKKIAAAGIAVLDCQAKCNRQIEKGLIRGTKAERLSGTVVQAFYNP